jgi:bifunctional non-homologous end joining protein LigD
VEGIISKRADAPYMSERGGAWIKVKTVQREKFPRPVWQARRQSR